MSDAVELTINGDVVSCEAEPGVDLTKCLEAKHFKEWLGDFENGAPECGNDNFMIKSLTFQSLDMFGPKCGFLKFKADVCDRATKTFIPGIVFMRGHSVGILIILTAEETGERFTVLTIQPRLPVPNYNSVEIPAGILDNDLGFVGNAAKEVEEETGIHMKGEDLTELTGSDEKIYLSAGACDEGMKFYVHERTMSLSQLQEIEGRTCGVIEEGEKIQVTLRPLEKLREVRDAKSLAVLALYDGYYAKKNGQAHGTASTEVASLEQENHKLRQALKKMTESLVAASKDIVAGREAALAAQAKADSAISLLRSMQQDDATPSGSGPSGHDSDTATDTGGEQKVALMLQTRWRTRKARRDAVMKSLMAQMGDVAAPVASLVAAFVQKEPENEEEYAEQVALKLQSRWRSKMGRREAMRRSLAL